MQAGMQSPLGPISVTETGGVITALQWHAGPAPETPLLAEALAQLAAYFDRRLTRFDLPLDYGSGFAEQVRRAMAAIPYGETRQYGDLAKEIGAPAQAIGQACGANPIPVLIPCHRILAAKGLGGFSAKGGVESKVFLLKLEGAASLLI
ncbi:MAG: methylated-DNA--[protein]-cysteine S-methyltransferase [Cypionkella sp.]|nr:methylated-DNA--[protein]-cysteine S-methyltransferase [Cypionkella sp.]MDZ4394925.1 methylated-DNA--[protein]-cysteine S-methyltransferase [Cypionkella sp.]